MEDLRAGEWMCRVEVHSGGLEVFWSEINFSRKILGSFSGNS